MSLEIFIRPHVLGGQHGMALRVDFKVFLDRVITKVDGSENERAFASSCGKEKRKNSRFQVGESEGPGREPEVGGFVHPDRHRIPVGDQKPLPDVEFGAVQEKGTLDVFLNHPSAVLHQGRIALDQLENVVEFVQDLDP